MYTSRIQLQNRSDARLLLLFGDFMTRTKYERAVYFCIPCESSSLKIAQYSGGCSYVILFGVDENLQKKVEILLEREREGKPEGGHSTFSNCILQSVNYSFLCCSNRKLTFTVNMCSLCNSHKGLFVFQLSSLFFKHLKRPIPPIPSHVGQFIMH